MFSILSYAVRFVVTNRAPKMSPFATRGGKWYNARRMKNLLFITDVKVDTIEQKRTRSQAALVEAILTKSEPKDDDVDFFNKFTEQIEQERQHMHELMKELDALSK